MTMQWESPPTKGRRKGKWDRVFAELKANPGRWARLYLGLDRNAHSLAGRLRSKRGDEFTIVSRTVEELGEAGEKQAGVWAMYRPEEEPPTYQDMITTG